jgi:hypothetical protein
MASTGHFPQSPFAGAKGSICPQHSRIELLSATSGIRRCWPQTISPALLPNAAEYVYFSGEMPVGSQRSLPGEIGRTLGGWFAAQVKVVLILTGIYAIGFAISGVPWWFAVAVVCGLSNFIPIVGAVIALLIALPVTWLVSQDTMPVLGALITYVVAQALEGFYLTPKIMGRRLGLSPWVVFLAILAGGFVFGPLGVVFAAQVVAVLAVLWRRSRRWVGPESAYLTRSPGKRRTRFGSVLTSYSVFDKRSSIQSSDRREIAIRQERR